MKENLTDITFILDRSGSMACIKNATISGFNEFLNSQKEAQGDAKISLVQFDNEYELMYDAINIKEAINLDESTFIPKGMTALLDAIGKTIVSTGNRLSLMTEEDRPEKVIFVILTDGDENQSRIYTKEKINEMIKHQTEVYNWDFVFLGANQDAISTGASLGFNAGNTMTFAANADGNSALYGSMVDKMTLYRSASVQTKCSGGFFDDADRLKQTQAGA